MVAFVIRDHKFHGLIHERPRARQWADETEGCESELCHHVTGAAAEAAVNCD